MLKPAETPGEADAVHRRVAAAPRTLRDCNVGESDLHRRSSKNEGRARIALAHPLQHTDPESIHLLWRKSWVRNRSRSGALCSTSPHLPPTRSSPGGYFAFIDVSIEFATSSIWGAQILVDFLVAISIALGWVIADARKRELAYWPFVLLTLTLGSIGLLAYLIHRERVLHRANAQAGGQPELQHA